MNKSPMQVAQESVRAAWPLDGRRSVPLRTGRTPQTLRVTAGLAWITAPARPGEAPADHWLAAGQSLALPARCTVWMDGWPQAQVELLAPARVRAGEAAARRLRRAIGRLAAALHRPSGAPGWSVPRG